jgi:hypothetical protein
MSHKPPKDDAERLANLMEGLLDFDEDEMPSREEIEREAAAAGIDFAAWGEQIRQKAIHQVQRAEEARIAADRARHAELVARLAARPRPKGTHTEKVALMASLVQRASARQLTAHFQKFEEATESELDEMIVVLEDILERGGE